MHINTYNGRKENHYVSVKELFSEYQNSIDNGECTNQLLIYFRRIAKHLLTTFHYVNKSDADAVIEYAVAEAWQKWDSYDPNKSNNIFAFYTTMLKNDIQLHYKQITKGKSINISIESLFANQRDN